MFDCDVLIPKTVQELTAFLSDPSARIIAGGTDMLPRLQRTGSDSPLQLIDISRLNDLRFIQENSGWLETGGLTTIADLVSSPLLLQSAPALVQACSSIGAPQTRARGTLGGNLANASPAADTAAPLLALDAHVLVRSEHSQREIPIDSFFTAPGKTSLQAGEFIHSVCLPIPQGRWGSSFLKLGRRKGMAVAIASAAVLLILDDADRISTCRIALGSVAPRPVRSPHAEAILQGAVPSTQVFAQAAEAIQADISPIDDVRATAMYRRSSASILVRRALEAALLEAAGRAA